MKRTKRFGGPLAGAVCGLAGLVAVAAPATAATYTVTNTSDSGAGSLRQAIASANGNSGLDLIVFTTSGVISLSSALPTITDPVNIDARVSGLPSVELNGNSAGNVNGLVLTSGASGSSIRGLIINRFTRNAISLNGTNAANKVSNVLIQANYLGTNASASAASANGNNGILANNVAGITITGNLIAGNGTGSPTSSGIKFTGENSNLTITGNLIGVNAAGTALGNASYGIEFAGSMVAPASVIGGVNPADANVIAFNAGAGISLSNSDRLIQILGNSIYSNGQISIDLGGDGVTSNDTLDADSGPNDRQNYPVLTAASARADTRITGSLNSTPNTIFRLEFFSSPSNLSAALRPAKTFLGWMDVSTDASGNALFTATVQGTTAGSLITATATSPLGNTSEVSAALASVSNIAPTAVGDSYVTDEDTPKVVAAPGVLGNDGDVEGDPLAAVVVSNPTHGTLTLNANGSFTYTPSANYHGPDSFTYKVNDGSADGNTATVNLTVNPINDAPVAQNDSYATDEDTPKVVALPGVLSNDSDVDGNALNASVVSLPAHGSLTLNTDGSFTYTPNANYYGPDSFTYKVNDGSTDGNTATVSLTVNPINDAPVAQNDSYVTDEDTPKVVAAPGVLGNDTDIDGDSLSAAVVSLPAHGSLTLNANGSFTYTPDANYHGPDSFTYKVNDGSVDGNTATVNLTVNPINDAPVAAHDSYTTDEDTAKIVAAPGVLGNDADVDGDGLTASVVSLPAHGSLTLNTDGSFTYTPNANYHGPDSFTYKVNDGLTDGNTATVNLTVNPINDAPVAQNGSAVASPGGSTMITLNATDLENDSLTYTIVTPPANGTLTGSGNQRSYTPNPGFSGTDTFTFRVNDGQEDSNAATITIDVSGAPIGTADNCGTMRGTPLTVAAPGVLANDQTFNSLPLTAVLVNGPAHGSLTLNSNGSFTYRPQLSFSGVDQFTYRPVAGGVPGTPVTVSITVSASFPVVVPSKVAASGAFQIGKNRYQFGLSASTGTANQISGSFTVRESPSGFTVEATQISSMVLDGGTLRVYGKARVTGAGIQDFVLDLENVQARSILQVRFRLELANGRVIGPANLASGSVVVRQ